MATKLKIGNTLIGGGYGSIKVAIDQDNGLTDLFTDCKTANDFNNKVISSNTPTVVSKTGEHTVVGSYSTTETQYIYQYVNYPQSSIVTDTVTLYGPHTEYGEYETYGTKTLTGEHTVVGSYSTYGPYTTEGYVDVTETYTTYGLHNEIYTETYQSGTTTQYTYGSYTDYRYEQTGTTGSYVGTISVKVGSHTVSTTTKVSSYVTWDEYSYITKQYVNGSYVTGSYITGSYKVKVGSSGSYTDTYETRYTYGYTYENTYGTYQETIITPRGGSYYYDVTTYTTVDDYANQDIYVDVPVYGNVPYTAYGVIGSYTEPVYSTRTVTKQVLGSYETYGTHQVWGSYTTVGSYETYGPHTEYGTYEYTGSYKVTGEHTVVGSYQATVNRTESTDNLVFESVPTKVQVETYGPHTVTGPYTETVENPNAKYWKSISRVVFKSEYDTTIYGVSIKANKEYEVWKAESSVSVSTNNTGSIIAYKNNNIIANGVSTCSFTVSKNDNFNIIVNRKKYYKTPNIYIHTIPDTVLNTTSNKMRSSGKTSLTAYIDQDTIQNINIVAKAESKYIEFKAICDNATVTMYKDSARTQKSYGVYRIGDIMYYTIDCKAGYQFNDSTSYKGSMKITESLLTECGVIDTDSESEENQILTAVYTFTAAGVLPRYIETLTPYGLSTTTFASKKRIAFGSNVNFANWTYSEELIKTTDTASTILLNPNESIYFYYILPADKYGYYTTDGYTSLVNVVGYYGTYKVYSLFQSGFNFYNVPSAHTNQNNPYNIQLYFTNAIDSATYNTNKLKLTVFLDTYVASATVSYVKNGTSVTTTITSSPSNIVDIDYGSTVKVTGGKVTQPGYKLTNTTQTLTMVTDSTSYVTVELSETAISLTTDNSYSISGHSSFNGSWNKSTLSLPFGTYVYFKIPTTKISGSDLLYVYMYAKKPTDTTYAVVATFTAKNEWNSNINDTSGARGYGICGQYIATHPDHYRFDGIYCSHQVYSSPSTALKLSGTTAIFKCRTKFAPLMYDTTVYYDDLYYTGYTATRYLWSEASGYYTYTDSISSSSGTKKASAYGRDLLINPKCKPGVATPSTAECTYTPVSDTGSITIPHKLITNHTFTWNKGSTSSSGYWSTTLPFNSSLDWANETVKSIANACGVTVKMLQTLQDGTRNLNGSLTLSKYGASPTIFVESATGYALGKEKAILGQTSDTIKGGTYSENCVYIGKEAATVADSTTGFTTTVTDYSGMKNIDSSVTNWKFAISTSDIINSNVKITSSAGGTSYTVNNSEHSLGFYIWVPVVFVRYTYIRSTEYDPKYWYYVQPSGYNPGGWVGEQKFNIKTKKCEKFVYALRYRISFKSNTI